MLNGKPYGNNTVDVVSAACAKIPVAVFGVAHLLVFVSTAYSGQKVVGQKMACTYLKDNIAIGFIAKGVVGRER